MSRANAEVAWKKDGKPIEASDKIIIESDDLIRQLIIKSGDESDAGKYSCEFVKTKESCQSRVTFMDSPFDSDPADKVVFIGDEVAFDVRVKTSDAQCQWSVNGKTQDERYVTPRPAGFDRQLVINGATIEDTGKIQCICVGHENKPVEGSLRVIEHLKITKELEKFDGKEGNQVTFTVNANKKCDAVWYFNRKIADAERFSQSKSDDGTVFNLSFTTVEDDDEAKIEVTLGGELKEFVTSSTNMRVESKGRVGIYHSN